MADPEIVSFEEWRAARVALLDEEKALTRHRDAVSQKRRELPMVEITKDYRFTGPDGEVGLIDLFEGRRQLLVYHFMWLFDEGQGCESCSLTADSVPHLSHFHARDTTFAVVSRAPFEEGDPFFRDRMGWTFPWWSSYGSDFNLDFHVTIDPDQAPVEYNYKDQAQLEAEDVAWKDWSGEQPGSSAFLRQGDRVFHTYSSYARAGDTQMNHYNWLDLTALGRQEDWQEPAGRSDGGAMEWVRRHDEYGADED